jgi:transcriptional regulator with XRE-family HTH domain
METYGQRVAQLRDELGLTQTEFAARIGVPERTLQDIETGKVARPQRKTRERIDAALGTVAEGETSAVWPEDVKAFLALTGAFLMALDETQRTAYIQEEIRRLAQWNR